MKGVDCSSYSDDLVEKLYISECRIRSMLLNKSMIFQGLKEMTQQIDEFLGFHGDDKQQIKDSMRMDFELKEVNLDFI